MKLRPRSRTSGEKPRRRERPRSAADPAMRSSSSREFTRFMDQSRCKYWVRSTRSLTKVTQQITQTAFGRSRRVWPDQGLPVYPCERTCSGQAGMSPRCQLSSLTCDLLISRWTSTRTWDAAGRKQTPHSRTRDGATGSRAHAHGAHAATADGVAAGVEDTPVHRHKEPRVSTTSNHHWSRSWEGTLVTAALLQRTIPC